MQANELDLDARKGLYGCSELGVLHGVDPDSDLHVAYAERFDGLVRPKTRRMMYGKLHEEATLQAFVMETGIKMQPLFNKSYRHPDPRYHLIATPDGLPEDPREGGVDCKLAGWDQRHQWGPPDDAVPLIPPRVELQVRGYMEVFARPRWYIAVWCGGDQLLIYRIERDQEFGRFILDKAEQVWQRYFEARERPPIGGNRRSAAWLQQAYPHHRRPDLRPATDAEVVMLTRYAEVRAQQRPLAKERLLLENRLRDAVKDREGLEWPHGRFTWRRTKDSTQINWEAMAIGLRTCYIKDPDPDKQEEARRTLTEIYTQPKPGVRRIRFTCDLDEAFEGEGESEEVADVA